MTAPMGTSLFVALGLMLVLEGLMPLISPAQWRETMRRIAALRDGQIRFVGFVAVLIGTVLVLFGA